MSSTSNRSKKYKRRKMNEKRGLAFLPRFSDFCMFEFLVNFLFSSDSDSDQEEELPRSQQHLKERQVSQDADQLPVIVFPATN